MAEPILNERGETVLHVDGREITLKTLTFRERHRLFAAVGRKANGNESFLADCLMFASVRSIDGVPAAPVNEKNDVEPIIEALGDAGCEAVQDWFASNAAQTPDEVVGAAKN